MMAHDTPHSLACRRIAELEAALTEIRDTLPLVNDEYARRVFRIAANAVEPEPK